MPGFTNGVRRRDQMGGPGVIGDYDVEGANGWRRQVDNNRRIGMGSVRLSNSGGGVGVLQLLSPNQAKLVEILGKKTGWDTNVNKREDCASLGNDWARAIGRYVLLSDC